MIAGKHFFDQTVKGNLRTYDSIRKTATGQGDNYTIGCLLDYPYFKEYHTLIVIDLTKHEKLDADPKAIQQINLTGNLNRAEGATMFIITEQAKEIVLEFSKKTFKVLWLYFALA